MDSSGEERTATQNVLYSEGTPELTGFLFYIDGDTENGIDLYAYGKQGIRPAITHTGSKYPYRFEVSFTNVESLETVFVTSTRNNYKTSILAEYDEKLGCFVAEGYFVEDELMYVPGVLNVEYTLVREELLVNEAIDWDIINTYEDDALESVSVTKVEETADMTKGTIDYSSVSDELENVVVDYEIGNYQGEYGNTLEEVLEIANENDSIRTYNLQGTDDSEYVALIDYSDLENACILVGDVADFTNKAVEYKLSSMNVTNSDFDTLFDISETLSTISTVAGILSDMYSIYDGYDSLVDEIMQSSSITDKETALKKASELRDDQLMFTLLTTSLPLLVAGGAVTAPVLLFSAMIGILTYSSDFFWENRINQIKGSSYTISWHIDPSGYVFDLTNDERIQGVTATAYCILYDYSDEFWDEIPSSDYEGEVWDALTASQSNPLITDAEGRYAWDVPEGWWRVKYEKEGYITTYSEWLPVPPPQTEVNIGMLPEGIEGDLIVKNAEISEGYFNFTVSCIGDVNSLDTTEFILACYSEAGSMVYVDKIGEIMIGDHVTMIETSKQYTYVKLFVMDTNYTLLMPEIKIDNS